MERRDSDELCGCVVGPSDEKTRYTLKSRVGKGSHGVVYLAYDSVVEGQVAIKVIPRGPHLMKDYVVREILNHRMLIHPHIIEFKKVFLTDTHLCIVMEYAAGGDLHQHVSNKVVLDEIWARWYFQQLVLALDYCHARGVWMRDIKLQNILLKNNDKKLIKICDFDFSKHNKRDSLPRTLLGSRGYFAPELILIRTSPMGRHRGYDAGKVDIWTCGVCLFIMLFGRLPFQDPSDQSENKPKREFERLLKCQISIPTSQTSRNGERKISEGCRDLLSKILKTPEKRISLQGIMQHPWFVEGLPPNFEKYNQVAAAQAPQDASLGDESIEQLVEKARTLPT
ncbi:hypothetical protein BSKO_05972 [Bryopsis sp. KO-2023]|nr:hypothetical protein BSKO_05972 [Bryopsis sp. KO-2023]